MCFDRSAVVWNGIVYIRQKKQFNIENGCFKT